MKITESSIALNSARSFLEQKKDKEDMSAWVGQRPGAQEERRPSTPAVLDKVSISEGLKERLEGMKKNRYLDEKGKIEAEQGPADELYIRKLLIEAMTGRKIRVYEVADAEASDIEPVAQAEQSQPGEAQEGWGLTYDKHSELIENETTLFTSEGVIKTSDGQELSFQLELNM